MDRGTLWAACIGSEELEVTTDATASLSITSPRKPTWPVPAAWEPRPWVSKPPLTCISQVSLALPFTFSWALKPNLIGFSQSPFTAKMKCDFCSAKRQLVERTPSLLANPLAALVESEPRGGWEGRSARWWPRPARAQGCQLLGHFLVSCEVERDTHDLNARVFLCPAHCPAPSPALPLPGHPVPPACLPPYSLSPGIMNCSAG